MSTPIELPGLRLERLVSRGTFSEVWFGRSDAAPARDLAIKLATSEVGARMLRAEAALYRRMDGLEGIPRLVDFTDAETPWLVLEWLGDRSFRDVLRGAGGAQGRGDALAEF